LAMGRDQTNPMRGLAAVHHRRTRGTAGSIGIPRSRVCSAVVRLAGQPPVPGRAWNRARGGHLRSLSRVAKTVARYRHPKTHYPRPAMTASEAGRTGRKPCHAGTRAEQHKPLMSSEVETAKSRQRSRDTLSRAPSRRRSATPANVGFIQQGPRLTPPAADRSAARNSGASLSSLHPIAARISAAHHAGRPCVRTGRFRSVS
jgi:hypothetical protein